MDGRVNPPFLLQAQKFSYRWPDASRRALSEITFSMKPGEWILCTGGADSGKSTLAKAAAGLIPNHTGGKIAGNFFIGQEDVRYMDSLKASSLCGISFQHPQGQFFTLTLQEEVAFSLEQRALPPVEIRSRVKEALEFTGLWEMSERSPQGLSGGEMQRLSIAILLAMDPDLLILDEPLAALDPSGRQDILRLLNRLKSSGKGIFLCSKDPFPILSYADRILVLYQGELQADTTREKGWDSSCFHALESSGSHLSQLYQLGEILKKEDRISQSLWSVPQAQSCLFGDKTHE